MTVSREAVEWAYRLILNREPESEQAIQDGCRADDLGALRRAFLGSQEYSSQSGEVHTVGQYFDVRDIPVEVEASEADIQAMMDRIAREWRRFGETEPHWSVIVSQEFVSANIAENIERFYESGRNNLANIFNPLTRSGIAAERFGKVLDFGCGVGRLSLALAPYADQVVGVDISPPHLKLARERADATGVTNADFRPIDAPGDLDDLAGFDLIVSLIVLQHNPPPVMAVLLRKLLKALAPGGVAVIQIPTFMRGYRFSVEDYLANPQHSMEMNALPQTAIFGIAHALGCRILEVREDGWIGDIPGVSQTFAFQRIGATN